MRKLDNLESLVFVSIISADNDEFGLTEDQKQEIISREQESDNWEYILECMPKEYRNTLVKFFNHEKSIQYKTLEPSEEGPKEC